MTDDETENQPKVDSTIFSEKELKHSSLDYSKAVLREEGEHVKNHKKD
jgi:hypothetical protein